MRAGVSRAVSTQLRIFAMSISARASYHAPAVRCSVARSSAVLGALCGFSVLALAALVGWSYVGLQAGWLERSIALLLWTAATGAAGHFWWNAPRGALAWDGAQWWLETAHAGPAVPAEASPQVLLDLQWGLLLLLKVRQNRSLWLWLERRQSPQQWSALRRAVYSRARADAHAAKGTGSMFPK